MVARPDKFQALRSPLCRLSEAVALLLRLTRIPAVQVLLGERSLAQRLTCCWILALLLVGIGTIAGTWLTVELAAEQRDYATIVNEAGSQRTRAHRIAAFLPDLLQDDPIEAELARLELERIVTRAEAVFAGLVAGADPPAREDAALAAHYFEGAVALAPRFARFLAEIRAVLRDAAEGVPPTPEQLAALRRDALGPILGLLDQAVVLHETHTRQDVERLVWAALAAGGAVLCLLAAIGLWIFRPMTRALAGSVERLSGLAYTDPLTGLANRRAMIEELARVIDAGRPLAAIAIDLDHFKEANERAGHAGGDALLRAAAERLRAIVRAGDIVGRIGGDEFLVFLIGLREEAALVPIVERIRAALHEPVPWKGRQLRLGATVGMALCPEDAGEPEMLLRLADEALMRAKREQRGSIARASRTDTAVAEATLELRLLAERGETLSSPEGLRAVLQPIVALDRGAAPRLLGFEALARWDHPRLGPLPVPLLFAASADRETALQLGRLVRRQAVALFAELRPLLPAQARLGLNLCLAEVVDEELQANLLADLAAFALEPSALCLEITEEVLIDRVSDRSLDQLRALRSVGMALALDDFGTGTSGLAQLLRLSIDVLKIDRRFAQDLTTDHKSVEIVRATLGLARSLDLLVVAEGVEDAGQLEALQALGCDAAQGFFFARPMEAGEVRTWLAARARAEPTDPVVATLPAAAARRAPIAVPA